MNASSFEMYKMAWQAGLPSTDSQVAEAFDFLGPDLFF
jgi:hypothetical protein